MERLSILCENDEIQVTDLPTKMLHEVGHDESILEGSSIEVVSSPNWPSLNNLKTLHLGLKEFLEAIEERLLNEALEQTNGVKNQAAEILGIKRTTLIEKLKKYGISGP